jgi:hypothetical protein
MATKLVRKPTTTKTSVGKETVNQTVARAKAMLGSAYDPNTKAPSASRMKEISEQSFIKPEVKKAYDKSVSAMALANTESPTLPTPTVAQTPGLNLAVTNASLGQTDANGMYQIPEMTVSETAGAGEKAAVDSVNTLGQQIQGYLGINKPEEGASEKALDDARRQAGVQAAQQEFNRYQNQINAITSQRDAQILSLEGQGRGQTQGFIGGEQARISREAAIMALPVQAQLAAAQGNLEQAKELMGQLYQAKSADIQADMAYRTNLVNSLISFASSSQQTVLQAKLADNAQASQIAQQNLAYQRQLGLQALEYGQTGLITGISAIDPKSPTFEQEISSFTSQLRKPVAPTKLDTSFDKFGNLINMQTGEVVRYADDVAPGDGGYTPAEIVQQRADSLASQIKDIEALKTHPGMKATVGAYGFARSTPLTADKAEQKDFIAGVEQLISQKFLDSLIDTKAKGGSFGALTKPEQDALTVAATKIGAWRLRDGDGENAKVIGYEIGEKEMQRELDTLISLAQKAESMARGYDVSLVPSNDSALIDDLYKTFIMETSTPANYYK